MNAGQRASVAQSMPLSPHFPQIFGIVLSQKSAVPSTTSMSGLQAKHIEAVLSMSRQFVKKGKVPRRRNLTPWHGARLPLAGRRAACACPSGGTKMASRCCGNANEGGKTGNGDKTRSLSGSGSARLLRLDEVTRLRPSWKSWRAPSAYPSAWLLPSPLPQTPA